MAQLLAKSLSLRASLSGLDVIKLPVSATSLVHIIDSIVFENRCQYSSDRSGYGFNSGRGGREREGNGRIARSSMLGQTEVFMQSGLKISELPLVVKKVNDVLQLDTTTKGKSLALSVPAAATTYIPNPEIDKNIEQSEHSETLAAASDESREIIAGLRRCFSVGGLFRLLETIPAEEVTPAVAVTALKLIINLDNHPFSTTIPFHRQSLRGARKLASIANLTSKTSNENSGMSETFLRYAFINMLLDIIYRSRDPKAIIEGE